MITRMLLETLVPPSVPSVDKTRTLSMEDRDDEAFLADLNGFLHEYADLQPYTELQPPVAPVNPVTDLLQDSDQLLAETNAFLSSYDVNTTPLQRSSDDATVVMQTTTVDEKREVQNAQAAKRRLKYRNKLKNEKQQLLDQEQLLSENWRHLQHERKKIKITQRQNDNMPMWEAVASRQMNGRIVAEAQQKRLKCAIANRTKLIQEVDEMMRQQLCKVANTETREMAQEINTTELEPDDITLFEEYLQDLDVVYKQTNEIFQEFRIEENPTASYKTDPQWKNDGGVEFFENLSVQLVPSNFAQTCSAMWQSILYVHRRKDRVNYSGVTDPENTTAVKCRIPSPKECGGLVDMLIHVVTKRYVEEDRVVIVWRALTEGGGEFSGMHSDETGWMIVRSNKADSTIMETFTRFTPMTVTSSFSSKAHSDQFAKLVVTSGEEDGMEINRLMQSLLIDDSN